MYRCEACNAVAEPRQPLHKHLILRPNGEIAVEVPVCIICFTLLDRGVSLSKLRTNSAPPSAVEVPKPEPVFDPVCLPIGKPVTLLGKVVRFKR